MTSSCCASFSSNLSWQASPYIGSFFLIVLYLNHTQSSLSSQFAASAFISDTPCSSKSCCSIMPTLIMLNFQNDSIFYFLLNMIFFLHSFLPYFNARRWSSMKRTFCQYKTFKSKQSTIKNQQNTKKRKNDITKSTRSIKLHHKQIVYWIS